MHLKTKFWLFSCVFLNVALTASGQSGILKTENFKHYIEAFNQDDRELYKQEIPNEKAWDFLVENIPFFECPDKQLERTYYFRWWTYRKHIKRTPAGYIITEFCLQFPGPGNITLLPVRLVTISTKAVGYITIFI